MSSPHTTPNTFSPAIRLGWTALVVLLLAAVILAGQTYEQLRGMRQDNERVRAQLLAESISQRISHAIEVGIPLHSLVGMEALFSQRLGAHADIQFIALLQGPETVLWSASRDPGRPDARRGTTAEAAVKVHDQPVATVRLALREASAGAFTRTAAALLLPTVLLLAALAFLAARFSEAQGLRMRNHAVRIATQAIASGRYDRSIVLPNRRDFDLRGQQLGHAIRGVHETLVRVRRLIASLRQTEPQHLRREYLDRLLTEAEASDRFADHGLGQVRVIAAEAQAFWAALLVALGAVAVPVLVASALGGASPLLIGAFFVAACLGWWTVGLRRWPALSILLTACAAIGLLAVAIAAGLLTPLSALQATYGVTIWSGAFAGAALAACASVEQVPLSRDGFVHALPRWHTATTGAWVCTTIWLGPTLGTIAVTALGVQYGALTLALPALCATFFLLRWNEPRSPWRSRVGGYPETAALHAARPRLLAWRWAASMIAAGLLASQLMAALFSESPGTGALIHACAAGLGSLTGLLMPPSRRRYLLAVLLAAVFVQMLAVMAPSDAAGSVPIPALGAFLTAYALGRCLVVTHDTPRSMAAMLLAGSACGALILACAGLAGFPTSAAGLAAALCLAVHMRIHARMAPKGNDAA